MDGEPKRPPPPKSYVPLVLLDGPPEMPPRPPAESEESLPPPPSQGSPVPTPRSSHPSHPSHPSQGSPVPRPRSSSNPHSPVPRPRTKHPPSQQPPQPQANHVDETPPASSEKISSQVSMETTDPFPVKPVRRKNKRGNVRPVSSIATAPETHSNGDSAATTESLPPRTTSPLYDEPIFRRHLTMGARPHPPQQQQIRYPPPSQPAPPPPTTDDHVDAPTASKREMPRPPPPYAGKTPSLRAPIGGGASVGKAPPTKGGATRPPPGRPARPPAVSPPPSNMMTSSPSLRARSATIATTRSARQPSPKNVRPQITVVGAQPMSGAAIPPPQAHSGRHAPPPPRPYRKHPDPSQSHVAAAAAPLPQQPVKATPPQRGRPPPPHVGRANEPARPSPPLPKRPPPSHPSHPSQPSHPSHPSQPSQAVSRPPPSQSSPILSKRLTAGPPPDEEPPDPPTQEEVGEQEAPHSATVVTAPQDTPSPPPTAPSTEPRKTKSVTFAAAPSDTSGQLETAIQPMASGLEGGQTRDDARGSVRPHPPPPTAAPRATEGGLKAVERPKARPPPPRPTPAVAKPSASPEPLEEGRTTTKKQEPPKQTEQGQTELNDQQIEAPKEDKEADKAAPQETGNTAKKAPPKRPTVKRPPPPRAARKESQELPRRPPPVKRPPPPRQASKTAAINRQHSSETGDPDKAILEPPVPLTVQEQPIVSDVATEGESVVETTSDLPTEERQKTSPSEDQPVADTEEATPTKQADPAPSARPKRPSFRKPPPPKHDHRQEEEEEGAAAERSTPSPSEAQTRTESPVVMTGELDAKRSSPTDTTTEAELLSQIQPHTSSSSQTESEQRPASTTSPPPSSSSSSSSSAPVKRPSFRKPPPPKTTPVQEVKNASVALLDAASSDDDEEKPKKVEETKKTIKKPSAKPAPPKRSSSLNTLSPSPPPISPPPPAVTEESAEDQRETATEKEAENAITTSQTAVEADPLKDTLKPSSEEAFQEATKTTAPLQSSSPEAGKGQPSSSSPVPAKRSPPARKPPPSVKRPPPPPASRPSAVKHPKQRDITLEASLSHDEAGGPAVAKATEKTEDKVLRKKRPPPMKRPPPPKVGGAKTASPYQVPVTRQKGGKITAEADKTPPAMEQPKQPTAEESVASSVKESEVLSQDAAGPELGAGGSEATVELKKDSDIRESTGVKRVEDEAATGGSEEATEVEQLKEADDDVFITPSQGEKIEQASGSAKMEEAEEGGGEVVEPVSQVVQDASVADPPLPAVTVDLEPVRETEEEEEEEEGKEGQLSAEVTEGGAGLRRSPSAKRKGETSEETGVRIIRYSNADTAGVKTRAKKPMDRPKPPRPVSMPPPGRPGRAPAAGKPARPGPPPKPAPPTAKPAPARKPPPPTSKPKVQESSVPPALPPRPEAGHPLYKYVCSEPHGLAKVVFEATASDELSYQEGDVIELLEKVDENWYYAHNADSGLQDGLILARNINIVKRLPGQDTVAGFEDGPCAVAMHDFIGQSMDELSFSAGDLIMLKARVDDVWLKGKMVGGGEGIFPKNYVEIVEDLPAEPLVKSVSPAPATREESTEQIRGPHCVALFAFKAEGPDELSLSVGDVVSLIARKGTAWLRGTLRGKEGLFPREFVDVKEDLPPDTSAQVKEDATSNACVVSALYSFTGEQTGELSFATGDKITVVSRVDDQWLRGECKGQTGIFPVAFVGSVPSDLPKDEPKKVEKAKDSPESPAVCRCEAIFDFTGESDGELTFKKGDVIANLTQVDADWLRGKLAGKEGIFPTNFVKLLDGPPPPPPPSKASSPQSQAVVPPRPVAASKPVGSKPKQAVDELLPRAVALFDYNAGNSEEISFKEGDTLYLLTKEGTEWFSGEHTQTGAIGQFPVSYVDVIEPLP